jgi:hypothetical protein
MDLTPLTPIGRNAPCPCGSGKKYKKCCLRKDEAEARDREATALRAAVEEYPAKEAALEDEWTKGHPQCATRATHSSPASSDNPEAPSRRNEPDWPPLSPEDQVLVDGWWTEVKPVYTSKPRHERCGWLLERTVAFLDLQPHLFRHLYLHEEFLFELAASLAQAGRFADYLALLRRLRREQPEVYFERFGSYDEDLLTEALRTGQFEDIPSCLIHFRQHPVAHIDQFASVVEILAWQGREEELRSLLEPTAATIADSPEVIDGGFGLLWLTFLAMFPFLDAGEDSPAALERLAQQVGAIGYLDVNHEATRKWLRRAVQLAAPRPTGPPPLDFRRVPDGESACDVAWSFTGWAHHTQGLAWSSARFLAMALLDYWGWQDPRRQERDAAPFGLSEPGLDRYLAQRCRGFFSIRGGPAFSMLQAFHYFTGYLAAQGSLTATEVQGCQEVAVRLYGQAAKVLDPCASALRLYPDHETLIAGPRRHPLTSPGRHPMGSDPNGS